MSVGRRATDVFSISWESVVAQFPSAPTGAKPREPPVILDLFASDEELRIMSFGSTSASSVRPRQGSTRQSEVPYVADSVQKKLHPKKVDLIVRACRGGLSEAERQSLNELFFTMEPNVYDEYLREAHQTIEDRNALLQSVTSRSLFRSDRNDPQLIQLSKSFLDFSQPNQDLPLDCWLTDSISVTNTSKTRARISVSVVVPPLVGQYQFRVKNPSVVVTKKQPETIDFEISFKCTLEVRVVLEVLVEDGPSQFIIIKLKSQKSEFGVPLSTLTMVEDHAYLVPSVLAKMRSILVEKGGLYQEGIFRLAGDEGEMKRIRIQLNNGNFTDTDDLNAVACLIKLWYRDFPENLLNQIEPEFFDGELNEDMCVTEFTRLPDTTFKLLAWLFELFVDVAYYSAQNKMSTKNLAIVIAPNLYRTSDLLSPVESLLFSQKIASFIYHVLNFFYRRRIPGSKPTE